MTAITLATVATAVLLLTLASPATADKDQYLYSLDQVDWDTGKAASPAAASGQPTAVLDARSDIECATLCEAASHSCVSAAWCPAEPAGKCRLLGDTADASVMPAGCRILSLTSRRRLSGGWCPWNLWTAWSAACHAAVRVRKRSCQCPTPQAPASGANCEDGTADGGDSQNDDRFMGWCGWQSWTSWGSGCNVNQQRTRVRTCSCATDPVATPSTEASQTENRFLGWCGWPGWSSWSSGCNTNQQRSRVRTCSCATDPVATPSTEASQTHSRFMGWCGWQGWSSWSSGCNANQHRSRERSCSCIIASVASPSTQNSQSATRFMGWCGWQGWSSWSSGCNVNQHRSRGRSCSCITGSVASPSTQNSQSATRFRGWCGWNSWSGWSSWYKSNCVIFWKRKKRTRTRNCACNVGYTSNPSGSSSQTDETSCTFKGG